MKPVLQAKEFEGYFWIPAHIHVEEVTKAYEAGAAAEREACASLCKGLAAWHGELVTAAYETAADAIRARNLENLNKQAEANGEDL